MRLRTLVLLVVLIALTPTASAHANYLSSDPPRGARLAEPPAIVTVTLSESIDPEGSTLEVRDHQGARVDEGSVRVESGRTPTLSVDLRPGIGPGAYKATWTALSNVDLHVTKGSFGFAVGAFEPPAEEGAGDEIDVASAAARTVAYAGFALAFGSLAFVFHIERGSARPRRDTFLLRVLAVGGSLLALGTLSLLLHTLYESGLGARGFLETRVGQEFLLRVVAAFATAILAFVAYRRSSRTLAVATGALLLVDVVAASRFAHSAVQGPWAVAVDFLHLIFVATWLGALALLLHYILQAARDGTYEDVVQVGRRFSPLALTCVVGLATTGLISAVVIVGPALWQDPLGIFTSPYRAFLASKITLFFLMIGIAGINRFVFLARPTGPEAGLARLAPAEPTQRTRAFGRLVATEASLGAFVLVLAGLLTAVSPPSAAEDEAGAVLRVPGFAEHFNVALLFRPPPKEGGSSNVTLQIERADDGRPLEEAVRVRVTIAASEGNATAGESWTATHLGGGMWTIGEVLFAADGAHEARVEIQTEEVYRDEAQMAFIVAPAANG